MPGDFSSSRSAGGILICVPASSEQEVDEIVMRAIVAGGKPWPMADQRPGYSLSCQDPDGHPAGSAPYRRADPGSPAGY